MKKILGLSLALIAVVAMLGTGTWAYFSSSVTVAGNSFTAGTLTLDGTTPYLQPFTVNAGGNGIQPGDKGSAAAWLIHNTGTLNGVTAITFPSSMSVTDGIGGSYADLSYQLKVAVWIDNAGTGTWASPDRYLKTDGTWDNTVDANTISPIGAPDAAYKTLNSFLNVDSSSSSRANNILNVAGTTVSTGKIRIDYYWPDMGNTSYTLNGHSPATDNSLQGAADTLTLTISLIQAARASTLTITNASLPDGTISANYNATLSSINGTGTVTWALASGSSLPSGITLSSGGVLSSTNITALATTYTFTVVATDSGSPVNTATQTFTITIIN